MRLLFTILICILFIRTGDSQTAYPTDSFKMFGSWINSSIRITYTASTENLTLTKKVANSNDQPVEITSLSSAGGEYFDTDVEPGIIYIYCAVLSGETFRYMECGGLIPLVENRGQYLILVDDQIHSGIYTEFNKFKLNLYLDGYIPKTILVGRNQSPDEIRSILQNEYVTSNGNISKVLLLGHIPVPYSGTAGFDGHPDHEGSWATDAYYADLDGIWTDNATIPHPTRNQNKNFPGDRKFDNDTLPSNAELEVGRVDMFNLPAMGLSEVAMINRYLAKNHLFKSGNLTILGRGLESVGQTFYFFESLAKNISPIVANQNLFIGSYTTLQTQPKLFSAGFGFGSYDLCGDVVSTSEFASGNWFTVFTSLYGSYLWDFDNTNSVMRASLFSSGIILTCTSVFDNFQLMALGKSIGEANRRNQTSDGTIISNLHGDPSLRINYPIMPSNLILNPNTDTSSITLNWTASSETDEPLIGYHIYRTNSMELPLVRLSEDPINATTFIDESPLPGKNYYVIKLITLRPSGSGSFYNSSIGIIDSISAPAFQQNYTVNWIQNQFYCQGDLVNNITININENSAPNTETLIEISNENGLFETPSFSDVIESVNGIVQFNIPNLTTESSNYRIKISSTENLFTPFISNAFGYYIQPNIEFNYLLNFDTLRFNISGSLIDIISIETGDGSSLSAEDSIYAYAQNGEFIFTINAQNLCGIFQISDTINSALDIGVITFNHTQEGRQNAVAFYPNPVTDFLTIQSNSEINWITRDLTGRVVEIESGQIQQGKLILNVKHLERGIYIATSSQFPFKSFRFIKE